MRKYYRVIHHHHIHDHIICTDYLPNKKGLTKFLEENREKIIFFSKKKYTIKTFEKFYCPYFINIDDCCYLNNKIICVQCEDEINFDQEEENCNIIFEYFVKDEPNKTLCFCSDECCKNFMDEYIEYHDDYDHYGDGNINIYDENSEFFVGYGSI